jgi:hypothetical protein
MKEEYAVCAIRNPHPAGAPTRASLPLIALPPRPRGRGRQTCRTSRGDRLGGAFAPLPCRSSSPCKPLGLPCKLVDGMPSSLLELGPLRDHLGVRWDGGAAGRFVPTSTCPSTQSPPPSPRRCSPGAPQASAQVVWRALLVAGALPVWGGGDPSNVSLVLAEVAITAADVLDHRLLARTFGAPSQTLRLENSDAGA